MVEVGHVGWKVALWSILGGSSSQVSAFNTSILPINRGSERLAARHMSATDKRIVLNWFMEDLFLPQSMANIAQASQKLRDLSAREVLCMPLCVSLEIPKFRLFCAEGPTARPRLLYQPHTQSASAIPNTLPSACGRCQTSRNRKIYAKIYQ